MGGMEALFVEILTGDHAQQQFGHEVRVVMPELALHANGFNPFSKMKRQRAGTVLQRRRRARKKSRSRSPHSCSRTPAVTSAR